jgi:hypothetical protein
MSDILNLRNILVNVVDYMEFVEKKGVNTSGEEKKRLVISMIKTELGSLYKDYKEEIDLMIELIIFITKLDKKLNINKKVKKSILDCISGCV